MERVYPHSSIQILLTVGLLILVSLSVGVWAAWRYPRVRWLIIMVLLIYLALIASKMIEPMFLLRGE